MRRKKGLGCHRKGKAHEPVRSLCRLTPLHSSVLMMEKLGTGVT